MRPPNSASKARSRSMSTSSTMTYAHPAGHSCGVIANGASADHDDIRRPGAWHAAHQNAATTGGLHQALGPTWAARRPATSLIGASNGSSPSTACTVSYAMDVVPERSSAAVHCADAATAGR